MEARARAGATPSAGCSAAAVEEMIVGSFGNLSSGKTQLTVIMLENEAKQGTKIFSNITLSFPDPKTQKRVNHYRMEDLPAMVKEDPGQFENSILFVDELHNIVEARRSSASLNVDFTQFVTQLGKLGCDLYYTSQILSSQIDLRLREMGDLFYFCLRYFYNPIKGKWEMAAMKKRIIRLGCLYGRPNEGPLLPIAIKYSGFLRVMGGLDVKEFKGVYVPTQADFRKYRTKEIVLLDREKYSAANRVYASDPFYGYPGH